MKSFKNILNVHKSIRNISVYIIHGHWNHMKIYIWNLCSISNKCKKSIKSYGYFCEVCGNIARSTTIGDLSKKTIMTMTRTHNSEKNL